MDMTKIAALTELNATVKEREEELKELKTMRDKVSDEVKDMMSQEGVNSIKMGKSTVYLQAVYNISPKAGMADKLIGHLESPWPIKIDDKNLTAIFVEKLKQELVVNPVAMLEDVVPEAVREMLNIHEDYKARVRG
jgi:hypothetical protein